MSSRLTRVPVVITIAALAVLFVGSPAVGTPPPDPPSAGAKLHPAEHIQYPDVRSIVQDTQGFLWFGINHPIQGGLIRHDGYEARHYTHDVDDDTSISHNQISFTYLDRDDVLWVGTIRGGLNRYNAETDDFTRFHHVPNDDTSLPSDDIETMLQTSDGTYWVGTETGLARFDPSTGKSTAFLHEPANSNSLPNNRVRAIAEEPATGELWIGTSGGLSVLNPQTLTFRNYVSSGEPNSLSGEAVEAIVRDADGVWWIGTSGGLDRYNPVTDDFTPMNPSADPDEAEIEVASLMEDSQGRLWVGHAQGLHMLDREQGQLVDFVDQPTRDAVLGQAPVQALFEDVDGAVWIGTRTEGVSRLSPIAKSISYHRHDEGDPTSINSDFVARIDATAKGLWVVTGAGVQFFDGTDFTDHTADFGLTGGWPGVHGILAPNDEVVWLGSDDGQLSRYDVDSGEVATFDVPAPADEAAIWPVAQADNGDLWFTVPWGFGVGVLHPDGKSELLIGDEVDVDGPEQAYAFTTSHFFDADAQVLWVTGLGLTRIDVRTGELDVFSFDASNPKAVVNQLWSVDQGPDGRLWLASRHGVLEFDPSSGQFTKIADETLASTGATDVRFGPDGRLWVVSGPTFSGFDIESGDVVVYSLDDEVAATPRLAMENRVSSKFERGPNAKMFAPTLEQGLMAFNPLDLAENTTPPPVVMTGFELFGEEVGAESDVMSQPVHLADEFTLGPDQATFTFKFAGLSYEHPERNQFRYKLDGFDDEWQYTTADRRLATYTNVPPGDYTFRVQASNNSGVWSPEGLAVTVAVEAPWYQTFWARFAALIAVAAVAGAVIRWRTRRQRERTRDLEERLAERVRHQHEREVLLAQVQEQSNRLQSILAAAPVGVVLLGPTCEVLLKNKVASEEFASLAELDDGGHLHNFAGLSVDDLIGDDPTGNWTTTTVEDGDGTRSLSVTVRPIDPYPDGSDGPDPDSEASRPAGLNHGPDQPRGWVMLWDDITELEELQERRARQERLAAVGRFAAGIAHDVNNVLNVIGLNAEIVNLDQDISERSRGHLVQIARETENASKFITQILDFSRQSVSERQLLDAHAVVGIQVRQLGELVGSGVRLEFEGDSPSTIWADPVQLERIVLNLLKNAQDAIGDNGTIKVRVDHVLPAFGDETLDGPDAPPGWVRLAVNDDGSGIAEDVLPTIFEPFVTTKSVGKGTGLGLAQVAGISAEHGGRVTVETVVGVGTTVSVLFPAANLSEFDGTAAPVGSPFGGAEAGKFALVIDGELVTQSIPNRHR